LSVLPVILNLKALNFAGLGDVCSAAECLEQAIVLNPDDAALHRHLSRIMLAWGRSEIAQRYAEIAWAMLAEISDAREIEQSLESIRVTSSKPESVVGATFALADKARPREEFHTAFELHQEAND
jgi:hypothetical protein